MTASQDKGSNARQEREIIRWGLFSASDELLVVQRRRDDCITAAIGMSPGSFPPPDWRQVKKEYGVYVRKVRVTPL